MERLIDMEDGHLHLLRKLLNDYLANKTVWAYGSRVKWNAKKTSDLDLVVWDASTSQITEAEDAFSESNLPFTVQLYAWENTPKDFQEDIRKKYVVLQEGSKIPKGWRKVTLDTLIQEKLYSIKNILRQPLSSSQRSKMQGCYPYYGAAGQIDSISDYKIEGYHLLMAEDGKFWVSNHAHVLQGKTKQDTLLLYYILSNVNISKYITGAVQPKLSKRNLLNIKILFPPLLVRKAITEVLSSLDDKIDLLHRQNKTLENIAQTLFRKWFIEDADEEWEEQPLDKIANYLNSLACQKYLPENEFDRLPVLKIRELTNGISDKSDWASTKVDNKYIVELGDVIFSWSGSLVLKIWNGRKCILNQHLFKVTSEKYPKWFFYLWIKYYLEKFVSIAQSKAMTMGHIKREDISNSTVLVPSNSKIEKMSETMNETFRKIVFNLKKIRTLETMRNTLLPRLINGEIKLN